MLPPEAITEFKQLYLKKYGVELSDKEATRKAIDFYALMKSLLKKTVDSDVN